jgi:exonuclease-1
MGINGLHAELKPYCRRVHVEKYRGKRLAADGYSWLHKGVYSCAGLVAQVRCRHWSRRTESLTRPVCLQGLAPWLARGRRAPYVEYCLKRVRVYCLCHRPRAFRGRHALPAPRTAPPAARERGFDSPRQMRMLRHFGVEPVLVFDGDRLPAKSGEEAERRERRAARQAEGRAALARGDRAAAESAFQSAIDVTPAMAREVMDGLAAEGFAFVVAPYEADSQLAFLARTGAVDIIATEDSDLAAYAVPLVLFKLDQHGGAVELRIADVLRSNAGAAAPAQDDEPAAPSAEPAGGGDVEDAIEVDDGDDDDEDAPVLATRPRSGKGRRGGGVPLSFRRFDEDLFLSLCVLAGCDFLKSLPGIGFKRAHALCVRAGTAPRLLALLRRDTRLAAPPAYVAGFVRALLTFRHARVWDAAARAVRPLTPLPAELLADDVSTAFLGPEVPDEEARGVAEGRLEPFTRRAFAPRQQPGAKGGYGRPAAASPMQAWPYDTGAPRRRSGGGDAGAPRVSPRREPRPAPPERAPPAPMNTSLAGMGHLLGATAPPPPMPLPPDALDEACWGEDDAPASRAPLLPPPASAAPASNPFARRPGDGKAMPQRVSSMFARAAADAVGKENGKAAAEPQPAPPPPPAMPAVPRGPLGRMWSGALSAGAAWIPDDPPPPSAPSSQPLPRPPAPKQPKAPAGIARFFAPAGGAATQPKRPAAAPAAAAPKRGRKS